MMIFASTRCSSSAVSLLYMVWGRALEALALLMLVKDKNTAFNQSINIIEFAETWTDKKMGLVRVSILGANNFLGVVKYKPPLFLGSSATSVSLSAYALSPI